MIRSRTLEVQLSREMGRWFLMEVLSPALYMGVMRCDFHSDGMSCCCINSENRWKSELQRAMEQCFSSLGPMSSGPWALEGSRELRTSRISWSENSVEYFGVWNIFWGVEYFLGYEYFFGTVPIMSLCAIRVWRVFQGYLKVQRLLMAENLLYTPPLSYQAVVHRSHLYTLAALQAT